MKYTYTFTLTVGDKATKYRKTIQSDSRANADALFSSWILKKCSVEFDYENKVVDDLFKMFGSK